MELNLTLGRSIFALLFAFFILWIDAGRILFQWTGDKIAAFLGFTRYGTKFLFDSMAGYILMGIPAAHFFAASVMSALAGLVMAKIILPETSEPQTRGHVQVPRQKVAGNAWKPRPLARQTG